MKKTFKYNIPPVWSATRYKNPEKPQKTPSEHKYFRIAKPRVLFAPIAIYLSRPSTLHLGAPTCNVNFVRAESNLVNFWGEDC